ncbi:MAG: hypothetical protein NTV21_00110 [Planctomycetota bacterium]|nr:hypothetical protein [Planctomycetota bacterium]
MALLVLTVLVAGFTRGPVLWSFAALMLAASPSAAGCARNPWRSRPLPTAA